MARLGKTHHSMPTQPLAQCIQSVDGHYTTSVDLALLHYNQEKWLFLDGEFDGLERRNANDRVNDGGGCEMIGIKWNDVSERATARLSATAQKPKFI